jgi:uncharacterized membrane protein YgcG
MGVVVLLLLLHFPGLIRSQSSWRIEDIPNPMKNPERCGRIGRDSSMVCDVANLLDPETKDSIDRRAGSMWDVEFAVVVIPSMVKSSWFSSTQSEAEFYANSLIQLWGVGDSALQNGALIFLSVYDRVIFISLGVAIQDQLSSIEVERVLGHVTPLLKAEEYGAAIERAIMEINLIITRGMNPLTASQKEKDNRLYMGRVLGPWLLLFIFLLMIIWILLSRRQEAGIKQSRDNLRALLIELCLPDPQSAEGLEFFSASCPVCFQIYLPSQLRSFDSSLSHFLPKEEAHGATADENLDDPSAEDSSILPETYETSLLRFVEESGKLRTSRPETSDGAGEEKVSRPEPAQEDDLLLGKENIRRPRLASEFDKDDFRNPARFSCGHIFCLFCLRSLGPQRLADSCPLCDSKDYLSPSPESTSNHPIPEAKSRDLVHRARKIAKSHPDLLTPDRLVSLETSLCSSREQAVKTVLELCLECNQKVADIEMRKRHIDDAWKEPGRQPKPKKTE